MLLTSGSTQTLIAARAPVAIPEPRWKHIIPRHELRRKKELQKNIVSRLEEQKKLANRATRSKRISWATKEEEGSWRTDYCHPGKSKHTKQDHHLLHCISMAWSLTWAITKSCTSHPSHGWVYWKLKTFRMHHHHYELLLLLDYTLHPLHLTSKHLLS